MELNLGGTVVAITGGTDGLGLATARRLLDEGAHVAICGRDEDRLARASDALGAGALAVRADVTRPQDAERFLTDVLTRWGRLDGLVNNAGAGAAGRLEDSDDAGWQADFDLKVLGAARLVRLALPALRAAGGGSIVNVLNVGAKAPRAGSLPTSASRAAGLAITKSLSKELGPDGIRVNAILVGAVKTVQWERRAAQLGVAVADVHARLVRDMDIPLGRIGEREEFADLAAFLLSRRASYVTGSAVNLDGGASPAI